MAITCGNGGPRELPIRGAASAAKSAVHTIVQQTSGSAKAKTFRILQRKPSHRDVKDDFRRIQSALAFPPAQAAEYACCTNSRAASDRRPPPARGDRYRGGNPGNGLAISIACANRRPIWLA
jgi:hypothetical protein